MEAGSARTGELTSPSLRVCPMEDDRHMFRISVALLFTQQMASRFGWSGRKQLLKM